MNLVERESPHEREKELSLVLGGPLYQLYLHSRLARPPLDLVHRRVLLLILITWVPLAVLSLIEGRAFSGVDVPFFTNVDIHVRLLLSLPLLIFAELIVHSRLTGPVAQFGKRHLIAPEDQKRFDRAVASAVRLRNSVVAELILLVLAWTVGHTIWKHLELTESSWRGGYDGGGHTWAGLWYVFVSLPIFQFLLLRWLFRLMIWYRFLWSVSRIPLQLDALHPDRAGGLGFLAGSPLAFLPVLLAMSSLVSAKVFDHILHDGATVRQYELVIVSFVIVLVLIGYVPLLFFIGQLDRARRVGLRQYGTVAMQYVRSFRAKWIADTPSSKGEETFLGSKDIQSLADLGNSFNIVYGMSMLPFGHKSLVQQAIFVSLPILPLFLTMIPLSEMVDHLIKMVL